MTKLCDTCPSKNKCVDDISVLDFIPIEQTFLKNPMADVGRIVDVNGGTSNPIYLPRTKTVFDLVYMIDKCEGPNTEIRGIYRRRRVIVNCSALGHLAHEYVEPTHYVRNIDL